MIKPNGKCKSGTQKLEICTAPIVFYKMEKVISNFKWYTMSIPRHIQSNCGFCFLGFQFPFLLCNNACWASIVKFYPQIKETGLKNIGASPHYYKLTHTITLWWPVVQVWSDRRCTGTKRDSDMSSGGGYEWIESTSELEQFRGYT